MRAHIIKDGKITNTIWIDALDKLPGVELIDAEANQGKVGDNWDGDTVTPQAPIDENISVPKWAAEIALIDNDLDTLPATYFASLSGKAKKKAQIKWEKDPILKRRSAMLITAINSGLITSAQVDALFIAAQKIAAE